MKRMILKYFSGTGNSMRIMDICNAYFKKEDCNSIMSSITETENDDYSSADSIGFVFPVYAFGLPRICTQFLKSLPNTKDGQKAFLLVTAGALDESGFALKNGRNILGKKGYDVTYTDVIEMPSNWTTFDNPPPKDLADTILEKGEKQALEIASNIANDRTSHHRFNIPKRMGYSRLLFEYVSFHYFGIHQMWRMFRVSSSCNACGTCEKVCPTGSVVLVDETPCWNSSCEQCMRCVNFCPKQAIFQTHGGETKGKNRYHEPHFKPQKATKLLH
ncbi:MAG: hypothetical protein GY854_04050 [Deltaproteobacteria bacterium]|nr:hypothetical protein [Deltaproteobacteria bacterium]